LAASSYLISANMLREVVAGLDPGEGIFCDLRDLTAGAWLQRTVDRLRSLLALAPALIFTSRVHAALTKAKAGPVECKRISLAAFSHRIHSQTARTILNRVRPKCLVIGNGNRPPEFALWAEARKRGIATVLLPYSEIALKPERFLSLCRGAFDLVLPFSESSANELRKLNPNVTAMIVGFPVGFNAAGSGDGETEKGDPAGLKVLYLGGNNFETAAADILREAVGSFKDLRLRVRLHPRNADSEARDVFNWLDPDCISEPKHTALADDIASSTAAMAVRSTAALDAMIAGVPFIWLSPSVAQEQLQFSTLRKQNLALLEARTSIELRTTIQKLIDDENERKRIVEEQWSRLRAAGYLGDYFSAVRSALRQAVGARPQSP
jgi:hypothetical protein